MFLSLVLLPLSTLVSTEDILMSQVFVIPITPDIFGWNMEGKNERRIKCHPIIILQIKIKGILNYEKNFLKVFTHAVFPTNHPC